MQQILAIKKEILMRNTIILQNYAFIFMLKEPRNSLRNRILHIQVFLGYRVVTLHDQLISSINDRTRDISLKSLGFSGLFKLDAKYNLEGLTLAIELKTLHAVSNLLYVMKRIGVEKLMNLDNLFEAMDSHS